MKGTELHIMMKQLINNQGASFITEKRFANILLDMGCFDSCPKCKYVLKTINEGSYANRILAYVDGYEPKGDTFVTIFNELSNQYNYAKNDISYCIQCILYGLNVLDGIEKYSPNFDDSWLNSLQEYYSVSVVQNDVDEWNTEYAIINVFPTDADVFVDGQRIVHNDDPIVIELACGEHKIKVQAPMYFTSEKNIVIERNKENTFTINLIPNYGSLLIITNAKDALVYIDDVEIGKAPISQEKVAVGTHTIKVIAPFYKQYEETFSITSNEKLQKTIELEPNYGEVYLVSTDSNVQIYIDGIFVGKGEWVGQLIVGSHLIECKRESHQSKSINIFIKQGEEQCISLPQLDAYYGCLKINVKPIGSTIYLDNELIGKSPLIYRHALIGTHKLKVYSELCDKTLDVEVKIEEGKITIIEDTLPQFYQKDYSKVKIGDYFYEDGTFSHIKSYKKNAIGIVFTLETTEEEKKHGWIHGQIIALKNCTSEKVVWNKSYCEVNPELKTYSATDINEIFSDKDGYRYSHVNSVQNNSNYEAIRAALNYNAIVNLPFTSGWYLPTIGQFNDVLKNLLRIQLNLNNLRLFMNDDRAFELKHLNLLDGTFWTNSLMMDNYTNFAWQFSNSYCKNYIEFSAYNMKKGENNVRAVAAF